MPGTEFWTGLCLRIGVIRVLEQPEQPRVPWTASSVLIVVLLVLDVRLLNGRGRWTRSVGLRPFWWTPLLQNLDRLLGSCPTRSSHHHNRRLTTLVYRHLLEYHFMMHHHHSHVFPWQSLYSNWLIITAYIQLPKKGQTCLFFIYFSTINKKNSLNASRIRTRIVIKKAHIKLTHLATTTTYYFRRTIYDWEIYLLKFLLFGTLLWLCKYAIDWDFKFIFS